MTQDADRDPAASLGSVAGEPVAWAAVYGDGDIAWVGFTPEGAADGAGDRKIIPLYRQPQPTLTDAERSAVKEASEFYVGTRTGKALSGLLERLSP